MHPPLHSFGCHIARRLWHLCDRLKPPNQGWALAALWSLRYKWHADGASGISQASHSPVSIWSHLQDQVLHHLELLPHPRIRCRPRRLPTPVLQRIKTHD